MSETPEGWKAEHLSALKDTIRELWPTASEDDAERLRSGITIVIRRRNLQPVQVFTSLVDVAENGRERLPTVGVLMGAIGRRRARTEGRTAVPDDRQLERRVAGKPWSPALWTAAFVAAGGRERAFPSGITARLQPWLRLVRELDLRPSMGVDTHPDYDERKVREADRRALEVWNEHGGISEALALKTMSGWARR